MDMAMQPQFFDQQQGHAGIPPPPPPPPSGQMQMETMSPHTPGVDYFSAGRFHNGPQTHSFFNVTQAGQVGFFKGPEIVPAELEAKQQRNMPPSTKQPPTVKSAMIDSRDLIRPCNHNTWEKEGKKRGRLVLRCMNPDCKALWKTRPETHQKCDDFYAGECPRGANCPHPHIYANLRRPHSKHIAQTISRRNGEAAAALEAASSATGEQQQQREEDTNGDAEDNAYVVGGSKMVGSEGSDVSPPPSEQPAGGQPQGSGGQPQMAFPSAPWQNQEFAPQPSGMYAAMPPPGVMPLSMPPGPMAPYCNDPYGVESPQQFSPFPPNQMPAPGGYPVQLHVGPMQPPPQGLRVDGQMVPTPEGSVILLSDGTWQWKFTAPSQTSQVPQAEPVSPAPITPASMPPSMLPESPAPMPPVQAEDKTEYKVDYSPRNSTAAVPDEAGAAPRSAQSDAQSSSDSVGNAESPLDGSAEEGSGEEDGNENTQPAQPGLPNIENLGVVLSLVSKEGQRDMDEEAGALFNLRARTI